MENTALTQMVLSPIPLEAFESKMSAIITDCVKRELQTFISTIPQLKEQDPFLSRKEAAEVLGICLATLNNWQKEGIVKGYRIGSRVRYKRSELESALQQIKSVRQIA